MKNVLVTGCCGFIGSNLCDELVARGYNVLGVDNLMNGKRENIQNLEKCCRESFRFIFGDIRDFDLMNKVLREYEINYVSHQAALGSVPKSIDNPILANDINVNGTLNLLWASRKNGIEKFVCAISSAIYGDSPVLPKVEDMSYDPLSPYAVTKVAKEMYCKMLFDLYGLSTIGLRYFNVYGKRQDPNGNYAAVVPKWILSALKGDDLFINGQKEITRDFVYIEDVVEANILALECDDKNVFGKGLNIGMSESIKIHELAEMIVEISRSNSKIKFREERAGDIINSFSDISLANKFLGFYPKVSFEIGLRKTIDWYKGEFYKKK